MNNDAILGKVRKLLRLSERAGTQEEAAAAAGMAQRLIDEHKLSTAMLEYDEPAKVEVDEPIENFGTMGAALDTDYTQRWQGTLAVYVAAANGCKAYKSGAHLHLIGRRSDADAVRYLYAFLRRQVEQLDAQTGRGMGVTWRNNYRIGVVETVGRRLEQARTHLADEVRHKAEAEVVAGNTLALVRVNNALATVEQKRTSVDKWQKANFKLTHRSGGRTRYDGTARAMGRRDGEKVDIGGKRAALGSGQRQITG